MVGRRELLTGILAASVCPPTRADGASAQTKSGAVLTTIESRTVSVRVNRPFAEVYEFLVKSENWNQWATGLGKSITKTQEGWVAETAQGQIKVRFTPRNDFGVVDHYVVRKTGPEVYVPMRLIMNGEGCELLFTLFREPGMNDERYAGDLEFVKRDLNGLKDGLEKR
jgi:hypothetical protein